MFMNHRAFHFVLAPSLPFLSSANSLFPSDALPHQLSSPIPPFPFLLLEFLLYLFQLLLFLLPCRPGFLIIPCVFYAWAKNISEPNLYFMFSIDNEKTIANNLAAILHKSVTQFCRRDSIWI